MDPATALVNHRRWLWIVIYSRLGDESATDDVIQEVSVAAVKRDQQFPEGEQAKSWLYRIAIRQVMLLRRRESRHQTKVKRYQDICRSEPPITDLQWLCRDETSSQVKAALQRLRPSDRQILLLKYSENLSCAQIAASMGVSESTIQTRLLRARRRLRSVLVDEYDFEEAK